MSEDSDDLKSMKDILAMARSASKALGKLMQECSVLAPCQKNNTVLVLSAWTLEASYDTWEHEPVISVLAACP